MNNSFLMPNSPVTINFSSYGQPSVNSKGTVVFRARSTGQESSGGNRQTGIYLRNGSTGDIRAMLDLNTNVPWPNNLDTMFQEFPAIPRIALNSDYPATRGNHQPVYEYNLTPETTTKVGTTGLYTEMSAGSPITVASKLGSAPGFELYGVPGYPALPFDVFPGAPTITDDGTIAFKGNFTVDDVGKTGIFFRKIVDAPGGGAAPVEMVASSYSEIPNWPGVYFGSTAPPSAAGDKLAFLGVDNEDNPTAGGIYIAPMVAEASLQPIAEIGKTLAGTDKQLSRIGEGLSFDGRYIAFWGAWGTEMKAVRLYCPADGNKKLLAFCNSSESGSIQDANGLWYQDKTVPLHQGVFVYDLQAATARQVASTTDFSDFVYWGFSGKAPGDDSEEDGEAPRWRAASFMAVSDGSVVFKARTGTLDENNVWVGTPTDGIYASCPERGMPIMKLIESGMDGAFMDPAIPVAMPVTGMGIERDGFRGKNIVITVSMALEETDESTDEITDWAGIYIAPMSMPTPTPTPVGNPIFDFDGDHKTDISIVRPSVAQWWMKMSETNTTHGLQFGVSTDIPVAGDYTGDGMTDIAVWRPSTGQWFILRRDGTFFGFPFGQSGDIPAPADFDGDGKTDAAVYRPSTGFWFIKRSTGGTSSVQFGVSTDLPVPADYDGDGNADIAIFRPSGKTPGVAEWWIRRSSAGVISFRFGSSTDKAVPGDYTGDGKADMAFYRPGTPANWFILRSENFSYFSFPFGQTGDIPAPGDFDGDGKIDATVFRPNGGSATWFIKQSSGGTGSVGFGFATDRPVPNAYVR